MQRLTLRHLRIIVILGILLAGCKSFEGLGQIVQGIADNAPPAKPPEILQVIELHKLSNTSFFNSGNTTFEMDVRYGLANRLTIMEDGVLVPEFDGNDPNNGAHTVQIIKSTSSDANTQIEQSRVKIFPPQGGYAEGRVVGFLLTEESINPKYRGTPQQSASLEFTVMAIPRPQGMTAYMRRCYEKGVPLPPDWAETGTPWILQGNLFRGWDLFNLPTASDPLRQPLLDSGDNAFVWTYQHPYLRGACIALPRKNGDPGSVAGIICQSAATGHACFWDNMPKDDQSRAGSLGWKGQRLVISNLADGSNLSGESGTCTACHRGNNVFLINPDDPTWAKVLSLGGTFTTKVETSSDIREDNGVSHPRYIPIVQDGWVKNIYEPGVCSASCHEAPANGILDLRNTLVGKFPTLMDMPPDGRP